MIDARLGGAVRARAGTPGKSLGAALLGALLTGCTAAAVGQVVAVIVETGSDASVALHRRLGFADAGR